MSSRLRLTGPVGVRMRSLAVLGLAAPMLMGTLLATAPAASASGSWTSNTPADGAILGANSFTVGAVISAGSDTATLTVTGRDADGNQVCSAKVTSGRGGPLSSQTTISMSFPSSACPTTKNARWNATMSGGASGSRDFATQAAPATPSSFDADGSGARDVTFTWDRGSDVDLTGYTLYDGAGAVIDTIGLDRCNGSLCSYALYYPSNNPGTHDYQLSSKRTGSGCGSCSGQVESAKASASATLVNPPPPPPPPPPSPTPTPTPTATPTGGSTTGGSTTGGSTTGGSTTGGSSTGGSSTGGSSTGGGAIKPTSKPTLPTLDPIAAARRAFAIRFNAFSPSLGIPKLPPLPANFSPTVSPLAPLPLGTYSPNLPYKPQTETVKTTSVIRQITGVGTTVDWDQLARSLAVAMILLLAGAHLRRFLAVRED